MSNRAFVSLLAAVLVVGAAVGGAFVAGLALGKGQAEETPAVSLPNPPRAAGAQPPAAPEGQGTSLVELRERIQSGQATPEEMAQIRQQIQQQLGGGGGGERLGAGFGGLVGTIQSIDRNTITLDTPQGTLVAEVSGDTTIQMTAEVPLTELTTGMRVTMGGERDEDGTFQANNVLVVPEGVAAGPFGGFPGGRGGFGGDQGGR